MLKLKPDRDYIISEVFPESAYSDVRHQLVGFRVRLQNVKANVKIARYNLSIPTTVRNAFVHIYTGTMRGQTILLTNFMARILPLHADVCECKAYPFPHREGGGKCIPNDHDAYCGSCGLACYPQYVDNGIGPTEFWGYKTVHHSWEWESDCCNADVFSNSTLTVNFTPEEY